MSFILITSSRLKENQDVLKRKFTKDDKVLILYKSESDDICIETLKSLSEQNVQFSFLSNSEDKIGYEVIFQLGEMVEKENIQSILFYDNVDNDLITALNTCGIKTEQVSKSQNIVSTAKRRGRKPKAEKQELQVVNG